MPRIRTTGFSIAPHPLMDQMHTAAGTQRLKVDLVLHRHGNKSADGCFASVATIAKETGINRDDTCLTLKWLVENGWAVREARPGRTSTYYLRQDEPTHPQVGTHPQEATPPEVTPPTHLQVTPPTHPQVTQTRTQEQEPRNKNPLEVEPPLPPKGGDAAGWVWVENPQHADHPSFGGAALLGGAPPPVSGGTLAAVPQAQEPAPSPPKRTRMAKPQPFTPTQDDIPAALLPVEAPLMAFWAEKGGQRTKAAWTALLGNLERIWRDPDGGTGVVFQQLDNAIQSGWTSITFANWKKYGQTPAGRRVSAGQDSQQDVLDRFMRRCDEMDAMGVAL